MSQRTELARITPTHIPASPPAPHLSQKQKAAIVVRYLLNEGADIALTDLPDPLQAKLTTQLGSMRYVDRGTLADVVAEFAAELEAMGLTFPKGVAGALTALDGRISPQTAARLKKQAGVRQFGDPWEQIGQADLDDLCTILAQESTEIAAVVLSKLNVSLAAQLLGRLPGPTARRITYAMSQTGAVTPDAVDRIGLSLASQLHDTPETAFDQTPVERVGELLNYSASGIRNDMLEGLEETDQSFADEVRKAIFTFVHIPDRLSTVDVPKILRAVDQPVLITALAGALDDDATKDAADFILNNISKRMAETLREEISDLGKVKLAEAETAMTELVNAIRQLSAQGEITLITPEEDGDE